MAHTYCLHTARKIHICSFPRSAIPRVGAIAKPPKFEYPYAVQNALMFETLKDFERPINAITVADIRMLIHADPHTPVRSLYVGTVDNH
jgi:hypothetical protein